MYVETKKKTLRCMKAHTYHMLGSIGAFVEIANFARGLDDPCNAIMVQFMRVHTAAHRIVTKFEITEQVLYPLSQPAYIPGDLCAIQLNAL
eukprot:3319181-Pyramimonas_sp.AAC.1